MLSAEEVQEEQAEEEVRELRAGPSSGDQVLHKRRLSSQPDGLIPCVGVFEQVRVAVSMIGVEVVRTYGHMGAAIYCEM
jgi:hypothetical protein